MNRIDAKYLTKVYKDGDYGLKNCSLSVKSGEFLVIVGPSGEGKSTLLKVLAGTEKLSSGELYLDGMLSESIPSSKRSVSMAFQEYVLYPHMTVFDNLATPLKLSGIDEKVIYDRVMGALRIFGLELVADLKPKHLSGGEQQRCALAKALLRRSRLVLLDEPMSNVDEKARLEYCKMLKKMKQMLPESTFIYVTHNPKEAFFLADRIAVMRDGRIIQIAEKDFLLGHFEHLSVMELLGLANCVYEGIFDGKSFVIDDEILENPPENIDYSKITAGQSIIAAQSSNEDPIFLFDREGRSLSVSTAELTLDGILNGDTLTLAGQSVRLGEEYLCRLLRRPEKVAAVLSADKFSKTLVTGGIPLIFEVAKSYDDHVLLSTDGRSFVMNRKTNLRAGEKIRLYYKIDDIVLYEGDERLTCHYPLHRTVDVKVENGVISILGKRIKPKNKPPNYAKRLRITESAFRLSYDKGRCSIPMLECLDEEFINGKKISHVAVKGVDHYLSFISDSELTCFGKSKVWININTDKLEFETEMD